MTTQRARRWKRRVDIRERYRRILRMPGLSNEKIDEMRKHLGRLARTICEHVWGEKLH
jgi:hypothetical protein